MVTGESNSKILKHFAECESLLTFLGFQEGALCLSHFWREVLHLSTPREGDRSMFSANH